MRKPGELKVGLPPTETQERLMADYEHTSLKPYVEMFEKHVAAVLRDSRMVKKGK